MWVAWPVAAVGRPATLAEGRRKVPAVSVAYVTYADAGRRLGVSRSAIWKLVVRGRLPTVTVEGRRYVPVSAVTERLAKRRGMHESTWRRLQGKG